MFTAPNAFRAIRQRDFEGAHIRRYDRQRDFEGAHIRRYDLSRFRAVFVAGERAAVPRRSGGRRNSSARR
jgi:hypothetical protein